MADLAGQNGPLECWCCGRPHPARELVRLGSHPEVAVCLECAHFLHRRARRQQDETHPSAGSRLRRASESARSAVVERGWHRHPLIGGPLRWFGRHLP